jgi:hypothetical protein
MGHWAAYQWSVDARRRALVQAYALAVLQRTAASVCRRASGADAVDGDTIGCEDQTLDEVVGVIGTPYTLHYSSDRTPGGHPLLIKVTGEEIPPGVDEYEVTVRVAGREFTQRFSTDPNQEVLFAWDGKDAGWPDGGDVWASGATRKIVVILDREISRLYPLSHAPCPPPRLPGRAPPCDLPGHRARQDLPLRSGPPPLPRPPRRAITPAEIRSPSKFIDP